MATRLTKIDELTRPDHSFLEASDECYYLGEYTARKGFAFSSMNDLVQNLKKPIDRRGKPEWKYKESAIHRASEMFREALNPDWLRSACLVPIPPSKMKGDPEYDDRLLRLLHSIDPGHALDIRELLVMNRNVAAAHLSDMPRDVLQLSQCIEIDKAQPTSAPACIGVFDDVLTTGAHFKAAQIKLLAQFPLTPIIGLFVARRTPETSPI